MSNKKLNDNIIRKLYSTNEQEILSALSEIKETGNSGYITLMIDLLHNSPSELVSEQISIILSEVKHSNAVPFIVEALENSKYLAHRETLVRICWENGLDYSNNLSTFVDILISGDYMTAFEAFTVIEHTEGHISEISCNEMTARLKQAIPGTAPDRKILIERAIEYLPSLLRS